MLYALSLAATRPLAFSIASVHAATYCRAASVREAERFGEHIARLLWPRADGWVHHSAALVEVDPTDALPSRVDHLIGYPALTETRHV